MDNRQPHIIGSSTTAGDNRRRVCFVSTTRADWGLLMPLAVELRRRGELEVTVIASNMHLLEEYGNTISEIREAGFETLTVDMATEGDDEASRARAMGRCMGGMAELFARLRPDAAVMLGDRYEMLAAAAAAAVMHIPVIHIAGGEISEGAVDDSLRHAITKLSALHLTATADYRRRVIQMGEAPDTVIDTGAIGVWNGANAEAMTRAELEAELSFSLEPPLALVTYHPATNDAGASPGERTDALLEALDRCEGLRAVITYPNNDAGSAQIIARIEDYARRRPEKAVVVKSLGMRRYHAMLGLASVVVGNSSSGIVEVPSAGIPTVDTGIRQRGRAAGPSVIHCGESADEIASAIELALSEPMRRVAARRENPYYKPDTLRLMADAVGRFVGSLPLPPKKFFNIDIPSGL